MIVYFLKEYIYIILHIINVGLYIYLFIRNIIDWNCKARGSNCSILTLLMTLMGCVQMSYMRLQISTNYIINFGAGTDYDLQPADKIPSVFYLVYAHVLFGVTKLE